MRQPCIFRALLHSFTLVLTLQSSSGEAKLGAAHSKNAGPPVKDTEKGLEVSTWLSHLSVVCEGHICKLPLRGLHNFLNFFFQSHLPSSMFVHNYPSILSHMNGI